MKILIQCGESTLKDFRPSSMNLEKGSVVRQLIPMEHNRLTVSDNISIGQPFDGYIKMLEYRNSARWHLIALEVKGAMEDYLETMMQGTTKKQRHVARSFILKRTRKR